MSKEFLGDRERALEDEFFHRVDTELWRKLRQETRVARRIETLRGVTGIQDAEVLRELAELDIGEDSLLALSFYPLVRVAWASRRVETKQREAVLKAAEGIGCKPDTASHHLLEVWLEQEPGEDVHRAWRDYVHAVCASTSEEVRAAMKRDVLARARSVAEAAGGILGFHKVSAAEEAVLAELEREFDED